MGEKLYSVLIDGKPIQGDAISILKILSEKNFFIRYNSIEEFIEKSTHDIWRLYGIGIDVQGDTLEEKSISLIDQLISHSLLKEYNLYPTNLEIALEKSEKHKVYLVGWIDNIMQRRLLHDYPGKTVYDKYEEAKKEFGEDILSFEFLNGESIRVKTCN